MFAMRVLQGRAKLGSAGEGATLARATAPPGDTGRANPQNHNAVYERAIEIFDAYYVLMDRTHPGFNKTAGVEVRERLEQLNWLLARIRRLDDELDAAQKPHHDAMTAHMEDLKARGLDWTEAPASAEMTRAGDVSAKAMTPLMDEIKLLTEAFYLFTERIRTILKQKDLLPYIGDPDFIGVSQVRNKLIEHYEPDGALVIGSSFGVGNKTRGPVLRDGMSAEWSDAGLYVNAEELRQVLVRRFESALESAALALRPGP